MEITWMKFDKYKPTDGSHYLVYHGEEMFVAEWSEGRWIEQWRINIAAKDITDEVEYWSHLPIAPKD